MEQSLDMILEGYLPSIEGQEDFELRGALDSFELESLSGEQREAILGQSPEWGFGDAKEHYQVQGLSYPVPGLPYERKLDLARSRFDNARTTLEGLQVLRGLGQASFRDVREALAHALEAKALCQAVQRQAVRMTKTDRQREWEERARYQEYLQGQERKEDAPAVGERSFGWIGDEIPMLKGLPVYGVKLASVRMKAGYPKRKAFAEKLGLPAERYDLLELGRLEELGMKSLKEIYSLPLFTDVVKLTGCNPYWLENPDLITLMAQENKTAGTKEEAMTVNPPLFACQDVILGWLEEEGKGLL